MPPHTNGQNGENMDRAETQTFNRLHAKIETATTTGNHFYGEKLKNIVLGNVLKVLDVLVNGLSRYPVLWKISKK